MLQTDANETFTEANWSPTLNFTSTTKPVLSHVLAVPELRQRYMAHMRDAMNDFDWSLLEPEFTAARNLIDASVQADPKKIYIYQQFLSNFTTTINLGGGGPGGGSVVGLQQFVTQRRALLLSNAELNAQGPAISSVQASVTNPSPLDPVWITAMVSPNGSPIAAVELFYEPTPGSFLRTPMLDDGASGDGAAGDGVYGALLPVTATSGQRVNYYVGAQSANTYDSLSFAPIHTEILPNSVEYSFGSSGIRVTEFMYSGTGGEYFELTNISANPIDLTGWSMDDSSAVAGTFDLSAAGTLAPGATLVVTEETPATFIAEWGLSGVTVLGPNAAAGLGRNDQINIFGAGGTLVERVRYGDEDYPGAVRTRDMSGVICSGSIGDDDPIAWALSVVGDAHGSVASVGGTIGSPGTFTVVACVPSNLSSFCFGDGGNQAGCTDCPCANNAPLGSGGGCLNSAGSSARLVVSGTPDLTTPADTLHFDVIGANASTFGILASGPNRLPASVSSPCFGFDSGAQSSTLDGMRCIGGGILRHGTRATDANGDIGITNAGWGPPNNPASGLGATNGFATGQTRHFQVFYRETPALSCMTGQATTQGVSVIWQ